MHAWWRCGRKDDVHCDAVTADFRSERLRPADQRHPEGVRRAEIGDGATTREEVEARAKAAALADAWGRLDGCGTDEELVRLTRSCLAEREARPADAGVVAAAVAAYQAGVEARLRRAEQERTAAEVRAQGRLPGGGRRGRERAASLSGRSPGRRRTGAPCRRERRRSPRPAGGSPPPGPRARR